VTALRALSAVGLGAGIAAGGYRRGALTAEGALAASVVGALTFGAGGLPAAAGLIALFLSGSWLSRRRPVAGEVAAAKGHRRDALQVLANGGVAALAATLGSAGMRRAPGAVVGALAAAAGDTWASELGVYSRRRPRSIVSGRLVAPGTSGGVTMLGWLAAAGGGALVGASYALAGRDIRQVPRVTLAAMLAGLAGSLADSLAGATVQAAYRCRHCGAYTEALGEHHGTPVVLVRGHPWMTNDAVNLVCTTMGGLVGAVLV
jgi:uncharacterized protein (TIGR00297 family)